MALLDLCHREDVGVIARTPLCFGFLTGAYSPDSKFDQDDHRSTWQPGQIALWVNAHRHFASVLGENHRQTAAQIALRFCLSYRGISTVIPGMLTREEVEENIAASEMGPFCENQLQEFERIYQDNTFFVGRD